jgi:branched-chain amino acid transport system substrate-binding protein
MPFVLCAYPPDPDQFLKKYQARAPGEGVDPLGYYLPPFAYANLQVLGQAVDATKSLDQDKLADYLRESTFKSTPGNFRVFAGSQKS